MNTTMNYYNDNRFNKKLPIIPAWAKAENMEQCFSQIELWSLDRRKAPKLPVKHFNISFTFRKDMADVLRKLASAIEPKTIPVNI